MGLEKIICEQFYGNSNNGMTVSLQTTTTPNWKKQKKHECKDCKKDLSTLKQKGYTLNRCKQCVSTRDKLKKEQKRERDASKEVLKGKPKPKGWRYNFDLAWAARSEYTRRRYADWRGYEKCYTCPEIKQWKEMDAGHFKHGVLDFKEEMNIHPQCTGCNQYNSGMRDKYAENLVRDYGVEKFLELCEKAEKAKGAEKYSINQLKEVRQYYLDLIKVL